VACAVYAPGGSDLYVVDASTGAARRLEGVKLNGVLGHSLEWVQADRALLCGAVPAAQAAMPGPPRVPSGPELRVGAGNRRGPAIRHGMDILSRPANQHGQMGAGVDSGDGCCGGLLEQRQAPGGIGIGHVDQVVRNVPAFLGRGLGSANVHAAVEQPRIGRDDLPIQSFGQLD
jgi:hypothetical protein